MRTKQFKLHTKDREFLESLTKTGKRNSKEFERAYILLALDKGKKHEEIEDFYNVSSPPVREIAPRRITKKNALNLGVAPCK